jgi:hypothetical protein
LPHAVSLVEAVAAIVVLALSARALFVLSAQAVPISQLLQPLLPLPSAPHLSFTIKLQFVGRVVRFTHPLIPFHPPQPLIHTVDHNSSASLSSFLLLPWFHHSIQTRARCCLDSVIQGKLHAPTTDHRGSNVRASCCALSTCSNRHQGNDQESQKQLHFSNKTEGIESCRVDVFVVI